MQRFAEKLNIFQLNKVLIVLRSCGSAWQRSFIKGLEQNRAVIDLADPIVREQALSYPEEFIRNLAKPTLLYHLQKTPGAATPVGPSEGAGQLLCGRERAKLLLAGKAGGARQ